MRIIEDKEATQSLLDDLVDGKRSQHDVGSKLQCNICHASDVDTALVPYEWMHQCA
jgi:hypothetical protein